MSSEPTLEGTLGAHVVTHTPLFLLSLRTSFFVMGGKSQEVNPTPTVADRVGRYIGVSRRKRGDEGLRRPPDLLSRRIWPASGAPGPLSPQGQKPDAQARHPAAPPPAAPRSRTVNCR